MARSKRYVAVDLGAGSGRVMLGTLDADRLEVEEVHRFVNEPVRMRSTLYWDFPRLFLEVRRGLANAAERAGGRIDSIGIDSWGVDFGLLDRSGELIGLPVHYRDERNEGMMEEVFRRLPRKRIFAETGVQFLKLNTLYQLAALRRRNPGLLEAADRLLMIADLVQYFLSGKSVCERTIATTTQMWNPFEGGWSGPIVDALGLRRELLPEVVPPGTIVGPLRPEPTRASGLAAAASVVATASHDTAAAVAAVPAERDAGRWAYLSSGTWSLLGVELDAPRVTPEVLRDNFTNEGGVAGTTRFLRNINGLWLLDECRRAWDRSGSRSSHEALAAAAEASREEEAFILPDHADFFAPEDVPAAIREFCRRTGQRPPQAPGAVARCVLQSLALTYAEVVSRAAALTGVTVERLHIVGGGCRNGLLNRWTAGALDLPTVVGPVEATAMGNLLVQAMALGDVATIDAARAIVRGSAATRLHTPEDPAAWKARAARFAELREDASG